MDKYFTFFFCGKRWKRPEAAPKFSRWLIDALPLRAPLSIASGWTTGGTESGLSVKGDYLKYRASLEQLPVDKFVITDRQASSEGVELTIWFERMHLQLKPAIDKVERLLVSPAEEIEEVPEGIKTFSFSIRADIWRKCQMKETAREILQRSEGLFVSLGCLYGYAHPTSSPRTGMFNLIWKSSRPGYPRVVDFDYMSHIERVCQYNFLSEVQLAGTDVKRCLLQLGDGIESKLLVDEEGASCGMAIYLPECSPTDVEAVEQCLGPLLWVPTGN
jgi:hypothetical protein